jgi:hypothetical protein
MLCRQDRQTAAAAAAAGELLLLLLGQETAREQHAGPPTLLELVGVIK